MIPSPKVTTQLSSTKDNNHFQPSQLTHNINIISFAFTHAQYTCLVGFLTLETGFALYLLVKHTSGIDPLLPPGVVGLCLLLLSSGFGWSLAPC